MQLKVLKQMEYTNVNLILQLLALLKQQRIARIVLRMRIPFVGSMLKENVKVIILILALEFL